MSGIVPKIYYRVCIVSVGSFRSYSYEVMGSVVTNAQDLPLEDGLDVNNWYSLLSLTGEAFQAFAQKFHAGWKAKDQ